MGRHRCHSHRRLGRIDIFASCVGTPGPHRCLRLGAFDV